jgi:hypothetical protein
MKVWGFFQKLGKQRVFRKVVGSSCNGLAIFSFELKWPTKFKNPIHSVI